nr:hypothetical protein CFP56_23325 [Quercus suber]
MQEVVLAISKDGNRIEIVSITFFSLVYATGLIALFLLPAGVSSDTVCLALRNLSNAFSLILELRFGMYL